MIFEDPTRRRWAITRRLLALGLFLAAGFVAYVLAGAFMTPKMVEPTGLTTPRGQREMADTTAGESSPTPGTRAGPADWTSGGLPVLCPTNRMTRTAFVVQSDPLSLQAVKRHLGQLDAVFPDWLTCSTADGAVQEWTDPALASLLRGKSIGVLPRLSNSNATGNWHGDAVAQLIRDEEAIARFTKQLVASLTRARAGGLNVLGVNLDFEELSPSDRDPLLDFVLAVTASLHQAGFLVTIDVPLNDPAFDYEAMGKIADLVVLMAYDQHYPGSAPGPVAGQDWFSEGLGDMCLRIPKSKLIVALGAYGYDWTLTAGKVKPAESVSFAEAMILAADHGSDIETDKATLNSTFAYQDEDGVKHVVWFLDAVSAWNQVQSARTAGVAGLSLWRLGYEEPGMWGFYGDSRPAPAVPAADPEMLAVVEPARAVSFRGQGELLRVAVKPANGSRDITFDGNLIDYAGYTKLPHYFEVNRIGQDSEKVVALTFDDGPDAVWTPQILAALEKTHTTATFFVVGDQVQKYPELLRQTVEHGHMVGNHTMMHPNLQDVSDTRVRLELNATQRLIEAVTGRQTVLFRAPYDTDSTPTTDAQLKPLAIVTEMGYLTVAGDIDSRDYMRPGAARMVHDIIGCLEASRGRGAGAAGTNRNAANVIVFHDGGGDRSQTVEAIGLLVPALKSAGYRVVGLNRLLGTTAAELMPVAAPSEQAMAISGQAVGWLRGAGWRVLEVLFAICTGIAMFRIVLLGALVSYGAWRRRLADRERSGGGAVALAGPSYSGQVAILVPAYNEQKVVRRTLTAVLASDYPLFSVWVIDDGSSDQTAAVVEELAASDPRVHLIRKLNGGKFSALNMGFEQITDEVIVTIDADTIIMPDTVRKLVAPMGDAGIDAVCGNVQVGNVCNLLTRFQDVEYVTSQNYDRRAFEALNCIGVVPGATGAWRREAVLSIGGYSPMSLTEDADLTLTLLEKGGRIAYAPEARSITEAPETMRTLFRQRFRWSYGTFQCLWKHRRLMFRGSVGWVALPNLALFQLFFPLLAPIGDIVLLLALWRGDAQAIVAGYVAFLVMDFIGALVAFRLDGRPVSRLWVVLLQRFYYRQFMYFVTMRAAFAAVRGARHGWNKLERTGTVTMREAA